MRANLIFLVSAGIALPQVWFLYQLGRYVRDTTTTLQVVPAPNAVEVTESRGDEDAESTREPPQASAPDKATVAKSSSNLARGESLIGAAAQAGYAPMPLPFALRMAELREASPEARRNDKDRERLLRHRVKTNPGSAADRLALARYLFEHGELTEARATAAEAERIGRKHEPEVAQQAALLVQGMREALSLPPGRQRDDALVDLYWADTQRSLELLASQSPEPLRVELLPYPDETPEQAKAREEQERQRREEELRQAEARRVARYNEDPAKWRRYVPSFEELQRYHLTEQLENERALDDPRGRYTDLLQEFPDSPWARFEYALHLSRQGRRAAAAEFLREAAARAPDDLVLDVARELAEEHLTKPADRDDTIWLRWELQDRLKALGYDSWERTWASR